MKFNERLSRVIQVRNLIIEQKILAFIKCDDIGVRFEDGYEIEILDAEQFASVDPDEVFWYYDGPADDKTREFCLELLLLGKFFRQSDIDKLSSKAGYNVSKFKGSYNCRHRWVKARIKGRIKDGYVPDKPSASEINRIGRSSIKNIND